MAELVKKLKRRKWAIPVILIAIAVVVVIFALFVIRGGGTGPSIQVKTAAATRGSIETTVAGSGSLKADDSVDIRIPAILPVSEMKVALGDAVKTGDVLATVDAGELQNSIAQVQAGIKDIDSQINDVKNGAGDATITAPVAGRVKAIAVAAGDDLTDAMAQYGYLIELSVDGTMRATVQGGGDPGIGSAVIVTLPDGSKAKGSVLSSSPSSFVVTIPDKGPEPGAPVSVFTNGGMELGSGTLEVGTPVNIVGVGGTVKSVNVSLNAAVSPGQTLITLKDSVYVQQYQSLALKRIAYTNLLQTLLKYVGTDAVFAETDGSVTAIPSAQQSDSTGSSPVNLNNILNNLPLSMGSGLGPAAIAQSYVPASAPAFILASDVEPARGPDALQDRGSAYDGSVLPASAPDPDPGGSDNTGTATVTEIVGMIAVPVTAPVLGGTPQTSIPSGAGYTGSIAWSPPAVFFGPETVYTAGITLKANPGYRFADVIKVTVAGASIADFTVSPEPEQNTITFKAVFPATASLPTGVDLNQYINDTIQKNLQDSLNNSINSAVNNGALQDSINNSINGAVDSAVNEIANSGALQDSINKGISSAVSGIGGVNVPLTIDGSSLFPDSGSGTGVSAAMTTLCTITPGKAFTMTAEISESDVFSVKTGQKAHIVMDAMLNDVFTGAVSKISTVGTSQSGVTTYPVTIALDVSDRPLLGGMNATANIVTESKENALLIPMDALQEQGDQRFVYLYDASRPPQAKNGTPVGDKRTVTTGLSDGVNVEVTSGLKDGDQIVYTIAQSNAINDAFVTISGNRNSRNTGGGGMPRFGNNTGNAPSFP